MVGRVVERAQQAGADAVVVAAPFGEADADVAAAACDAGAEVVRGSEDDVLARFVQAILRYDLDLVVRLTADNPLVDPGVVRHMIQKGREDELDYLHNVRESGFPLGTYVEVVRAASLIEAFARSDDPDDHEHVTSYLYARNTNIRTGSCVLIDLLDTVGLDREAVIRPRSEAGPALEELRLTVDTEADYELMRWIYDQADTPPAKIDLGDVWALAQAHPESFRRNADVPQKSLSSN